MVSSSSKNNDTNREQDDFPHHPYNTRSSRKHQQKNYTQPKDNTTSVTGSTDIVKGKPAAGDSAKKVPNTLYNCVKEALAARKVWEAKRDRHSELMLQFAEKMVDSSAYYYKYIDPVLPRNWKYNPDTAGNVEPIDNIPTKSFEDSDDDSDYPSDSSSGSSSYSSSDCGYDISPILLCKLMDVPLNEDDIQIWLQFKKFDEGYPTSHEPNFPVNIQHPFVNVVGYFAVNCFNEAFKEFVDKDEHNHIRDPAFTDCTYFNTGESYWFNMNMLADEYGFRGMYTARVECTIDNGARTLHRFVLTDIKCGKKGRPPKSKSSKDVDLEPSYTGMWARTPSNCFRKCPITYGYDYHNPSSSVCHWTGPET